MATIQDQQQSVWADEEQFPADILRLCFSALDESCSDWPERKAIVAAMGVCAYWRDVMNDLLLKDDEKFLDKNTAGSNTPLYSWFCHPRRILAPVPGQTQILSFDQKMQQLQSDSNSSAIRPFVYCLIERLGSGRFRSYKMYLSASAERGGDKCPGKLLLHAHRRHHTSLRGSSSFLIEVAGMKLKDGRNAKSSNSTINTNSSHTANRVAHKTARGPIKSVRSIHEPPMNKNKSQSMSPRERCGLSSRIVAHSATTSFSRTRSNFLGTRFSIEESATDNTISAPTLMRSQSMNDVSTKSDSGQLNDYQKSLGGHMEGKWKNGGSVSYELNIGGLLGPRKMTACLPVQSYRGDENRQSFVKLKSKTPTWHEDLHCWCLDFNGRVTEASVKNFQLVESGNKEEVIMQFGKIGANIFTCDFRYPLTIRQAFAIALTSLDSKIGCE